MSANRSSSSAPRPELGSAHRRKHEEFKNQLVNEVFSVDNKGRVPMEKVTMLIWQFRDDPTVVQFMAQFVAKFSGSRHVFDGIEFYLPQIAHMIIHLEASWDEAILENFALVIAQQSQHFALQLTWILQGAIEDYQPETVEGKPNPSYNQLFYSRCITLLSNIERCVVYGSPRSVELQRMYEKGDISRTEYEQMKLEDRLNNARQITKYGSNFRHHLLSRVKSGLPLMSPPPQKGGKKGKDSEQQNQQLQAPAEAAEELSVTGKMQSSYGGYLLYKRPHRMACYKRKPWKSRYFKIMERMLYCYNLPPHKGGRLVRAMPLESAVVTETQGGKYPHMFEVKNQHFHFVMRAKGDQEVRLWIKMLKGESEANALIPHILTDDNFAEEKKEGDVAPATPKRKSRNETKLTTSQQARYDFFKNERDFVAAVCDVAEVLRFRNPKERKKLAPGLVAEVPVPPCAYVPLCKSTDVWRRVDSVIPNDTRVFNTNERCPMIYYFVAKRVEKIGSQYFPKNPNLDVVEFLHSQFQIPEAPKPSGSSLKVIGEYADHEGQEITANESLNMVNEDEEKEEEDDDLMADPTDILHNESGGSVWTEGGMRDSVLPKKGDAGKGNRQLQKYLRENLVKIPSTLATRINRLEHRLESRKKSFLDRNTTPMKNTPIKETVIIEGRDEDNSDCVSLDGQSVVSVGGGSILYDDQVVAFEEDDGIDKACLDRAKAIVCGGESWAEKSARMLRATKSEKKTEDESAVLEIVTFMAKSNDDLRQEVFVMQMIHYYESVFANSKLPLWLKTYRILSTSKSTGLIEALLDSTSLDGLKKSDKFPAKGGLRAYFEQVYGPPTSKSFLVAQKNFTQSLAAYSIVSYLLGLKDRHNGNIMIDTRGRVIFIDFGFAFGMAPGHEWSFERAPFKLVKDYVDVMGGPTSECFMEFQKLFVDGFKAARSNSLTALGLVEIMMHKSNYPCFTGPRYGGGTALKKFEKRLMLDVPDHKVDKKALQLIKSSMDNAGTKAYDVFQYHSNGYAF